MPRILFISHNYPPTLSSETLLVFRTVRYLAENGWNIHVVTTRKGDTTLKLDKSLCDKLPSTIETVRTPSWDSIIRGIPLIGRRIVWALQEFVLPEAAFLWHPGALRAARKVQRKHSCDLIYSRAQKHVSNVVAFSIKRHTGLPWVAHFSDPWADVPCFQRSGMVRRIIARLERAIIREADAVVFVNRQTADLVMKKYPSEWRKKVHVIPHGFDPEIAASIQTHSKPDPDRAARLIYTGCFLPGFRTPEFLFEALEILNTKHPLEGKLELHLVGPDMEEYRDLAELYGIEKIVRFKDEVPFTECQELTANSDLLLVVDAPSENSVFLPLKVIDYLPFEKPILGITPEKGAAADVLRECGHPCVPPEDPEAIAAAIENFLETWEKGANTAIDSKKVARFQNPTVTAELCQVFDSVLKK